MKQRIGTVTLTKGMINSNYLLVSSVLHLFPNSAIGGPTDSQRGSQLEIHSGTGKPISTDIAGDKSIFRNRGWTRNFFEIYQLKPGEKVNIEEIGPSQYHVYPQRTS